MRGSVQKNLESLKGVFESWLGRGWFSWGGGDFSLLFFPCSLPAFRKGKKKKKSSCLPLLFLFFLDKFFLPYTSFLLSHSFSLYYLYPFSPHPPPPLSFFLSFLFTAFIDKQTLNSQIQSYSLKLPTSESNFQVDLHNKFERFKIQERYMNFLFNTTAWGE